MNRLPAALPNDLRHQKGSWSRDEFLYWHKFILPKDFIGGDTDFNFVSSENGKVLGILDFKQLPEKDITPTERIIYNFYINLGMRVFIAIGDLNEVKGKWVNEIWAKDRAENAFSQIKVWEYFGYKKALFLSKNFIEFEAALRAGVV